MAQALLSSHSTHARGMPAGTNGGRWHTWHTNGIELRLNLQGHVWDETENSYGNDTGAAKQKGTRLNGTGEIRVDTFLGAFLWKSTLAGWGRGVAVFNI